jgi:hypothetical protein
MSFVIDKDLQLDIIGALKARLSTKRLWLK